MNLSANKEHNRQPGRPGPANSRDKIVSAAKKVFSRNPYHTATLRMVGKEAGINHQAIAHYFSSKADLFEAVAAETCDGFHAAIQASFEGLDRVGIEEGLGLFVQRLLDYHHGKPEALRIMALNAPLIERLDEIPGYRHIIAARSKTRETFRRNLPSRADRDNIERFATTFDTAILAYLGAAPSQAEILGMDPAGEEYRAWVQETLISVFLPALVKLIQPE